MNDIKMHGMIYYYYDKVLVADCRLRTLEPYMGRADRKSVVQLLVYSLGTETVPLSAPVGISADGDFYFAAVSEKIIYQIHKSGSLIRAYAAEPDLVEETITAEPMAVLAMLQGKMLLNAAFLPAGDGIYIFLGETKHWKNCGLLYEGAVLITEGRKGWQGIPCSYPGYEAAQSLASPRIPALKGIFAVRHGEKENEIVPIASKEAKRELMLEHSVGFSMFSKELKWNIKNSESLDKICENIPMSILKLGEDCREREMVREDILTLIRKAGCSL